ncbi:serine acetyltransferase [Halarchaeum rubridurum]|uniref:Serine acetyltransferase n=1 Tax=Halarchaeum rubridurum TaxID=489911 RepID=A0A830FN34_9EURY|nr:serine acetyltransferase [Halarchaeum rubridurum]
MGSLARFRADLEAVLEADPAAKSRLEVLLCYPGLHAVWAHVLTHALWEDGERLLARVISQLVRWLTGVEIHPGAELGERVVIDHGMGVVIGETAVVGDDVHMYHGVTLGGANPRPVKRHPTVGDGVTIGADATLLGDIEVGDGAKVGAGAVVTTDVEPGATMIGVPAERVDRGADTEADESGVATPDDTTHTHSDGTTDDAVDADADE